MASPPFELSGNLVDAVAGDIYSATITVTDGVIASIRREPENFDRFLLPPFVDGHIHIESSMLTPAAFARQAACHGTGAVVADPHEIANVLGIAGIDYMIENAHTVPFTFGFTAPSCVPASPLESTGATLGPADVEALLSRDEIVGLGEVMNYPGVLAEQKDVIEKIDAAKRLGKPVDGHAPGVTGDDLKRYVAAGIGSDHECFTLDEAREKIKAGMRIQIREGSAAKNFDELSPLLAEHAASCMFASDDLHPDDLLTGHINLLVQRAVEGGLDPVTAVQVATRNPVEHYRLDVGLLQEGDPADVLVVDDLEGFNVQRNYHRGTLIAENGNPLIPEPPPKRVNVWQAETIMEHSIAVADRGAPVRVILARDGQLVTGQVEETLPARNGQLRADPDRDLLKLVVVNRYRKQTPAIGFIRGFGLARGAIASSVAHDAHNVIAVGTDDASIVAAVNLVCENQGGLACVDPNDTTKDVLPLPIAGIISDKNAPETAARYQRLDHNAKKLGSPLTAPYMTLSFMALSVIPTLKLSDHGLVDVETFDYVPLYVE